MSDRRTSFNPARAMGIAPRKYEDYFDDETLPPPNFNPDRGYSAKSQMIAPYDSFANQFSEAQASDDLAALDAHKDTVNPQSDILQPQAQDRRLNYMMRGVISPHQEAIIESTQKPPTRNKYSEVDPDVVMATTSIDLIDPSDENALASLHKVWKDLDEHPELGGSNIKAHPFLRGAFENKERSIYAARAHQGVRPHPDREAISGALKEGASFDDMAPFLDESGEKIVDPRGFLEARAQAARNKSILSPKIRSKLDDLAIKAQEAARSNPLPAAKQAWLSAQGIEAPTKEDWDAAYHALKYGPMEEYHAFEAQLRQQGYKPLGGRKVEAEPAPTVPAKPAESSLSRTPSGNAMAYLREHPDLAPQYEALYGPGSAAKVLGSP